jgi:signal transduction histidine kinase
VNPREPFDERYRSFYGLIGGQIASAISSARAYENERKRAEALAELDRAKIEFFSNVSHEFRTPLTLMLGPIAQLLRDADPDDAPLLETAHRNALRLLKLVNTLLEFSRLEAGRGDATFVETDLAGVTRDLCGLFRSAVESAGLRFAVEVDLAQRAFVDWASPVSTAPTAPGTRSSAGSSTPPTRTRPSRPVARSPRGCARGRPATTASTKRRSCSANSSATRRATRPERSR